MKKRVAIFLCFFCLLLSGCQSKPTKPEVWSRLETGTFGKQLEKRMLRMFNLDGELYFDTGLVSKTEARCGTLDRKLRKKAELGEVPKRSGTANFECDGCQIVTKITCEVPIDGEWVIFKKFENLAGETKNMTGFPCCFYIKGRMNNAEIDSELAVLTDDPLITFSDIFEPMLSSQYLPDAPKKAVSFDFVQSGDPWGISCSVKNLTNQGMTFLIEQFGGKYDGELQTSGWYQIFKQEDETWIPVETKPLINLVWNSVAYRIPKHDITEIEIQWKWLYGELPPGNYRLDKKIMDFRDSGDFNEEIYSVYFTIE
ncbi:MAG: hypothetical protein J6A61_04695 [Clostridia bacterium]|nr:hypothetical protein [Clostridia bacterium]